MLDKLRQIGYEIIEEEKLPKVDEIKFRNSLGGTSRRLGCLRRCKLDETYRIIINTTKARWFKDENGKYVDKTTGEKFRKATVGEKISDDDLKEYLAHEIAHLRFWKHSPEHKSYTKYLLDKINEKI